jgi:hypothetical protein
MCKEDGAWGRGIRHMHGRGGMKGARVSVRKEGVDREQYNWVTKLQNIKREKKKKKKKVGKNKQQGREEWGGKKRQNSSLFFEH